MKTPSLLHNAAAHRFEYRIGEHTAYIAYEVFPQGVLQLTHTEVPAALGGQGIGSALVRDVLQYIEQEHLTIVPACPFIRNYIQHHTEWASLIAPEGQRSGGS